MITYDDLLRIDIFKDLSRENLLSLIPHLTEKNFPPGITVVYHGDPGYAMFLVRAGTLAVTLINSEGVEYTINTMEPGNIFGEMALMTGEPRSANVKTLSDVRLFELRQKDFFDLVLKYPTLNENILRLLVRRRTNSAIFLHSASVNQKGNIATLFAQPPPAVDRFIGRTKWSSEFNLSINRLADTSGNVLICGERGTGKDLTARLIHFNGIFKNQPLYHLDCANPPPVQRVSKEGIIEEEEMLHREIAQESALFGHGRGIGSYDQSIRRGYLELSDKGAVILENIDTLSLRVQRLLINFIQTGTFVRMGETEQIASQVRLLVTTSESLNDQEGKGTFISELQKLIADEILSLKPLRERKKDIPVIAKYFLREFNQKFNKNISSFSSTALNLLVDHDWPLNVDELSQVVERAVVVATNDTIQESQVFLNIPTFTATGKYNLLRNHSFRRLVDKKYFPAGLRFFTIPFFLALIFFTFTGPLENNPANLLAWTVLWPFLILSTLISSRGWCGYCPLPFISNRVNFYREKFPPVPDCLVKNGVWIGIFGFAAILVAEHTTHMFTSAPATGILFLSILGGTIVVDFFFGKRTWCKYVCPLGEMISQVSVLSFVELETNSTICMSQCLSHDCVKDENCPMGLHPTAAAVSKDCILCLSCVKKCPHQAVHINVRLPWKELLLRKKWDITGAFFAVSLAALILAMHLPIWKPFSSYMSWQFTANLRSVELMIAVIIGLTFIALTFFASGFPKGASWKHNFVVSGYAYLFLVSAGLFNIYFHEFVYHGQNLIPWIIEQFGLCDVISSEWVTPNLGTLKAVIPVATVIGAITSITVLSRLSKKHAIPARVRWAHQAIMFVTALLFLLIL